LGKVQVNAKVLPEAAAKSAGETFAPLAPALEAVRGMNEIAKTTDGKIALQRWRNGQDLNPAQSRLIEQYRSYEKQHNDAADAARPKGAGGWMKTTRPHTVAPELYALETIQDPRERTHAIRSLKSQWRDDPKSAFNDTSHGDHKNAIEWMGRLYQAESELGPQPEDPK
jgi:hypothetical protein